MTTGTHFQPILVDEAKDADKVIFVCGKLYYDLHAEREKLGLTDKVAFIRLEEICPFPWRVIHEAITQFKDAKEFVWIQEEPQNQVNK